MPTWRLTRDGALSISAPPALLGEWLPIDADPGPPGAAHLDLVAAPLNVLPPAHPSTLSLLDVTLWLSGDRALLRSRSGALDGEMDLAARHGRLGIQGGAHAEPLLTIASALLLSRLGRALVHAAGVVAPDGRAWLLVGDTHSGKSTTLATLARAGWGWLADDQVIARLHQGEVVAEGWPRRLNLDAGYAEGLVTGTRQPVQPGRIGDPVRSECPLGGVLLASVEPEAPTRLTRASPADAFAALVRQSPWLLADGAAARISSRVLAATAELPAASLAVGRDCYRRADALLAALAPLIQTH